VVEWEGEAGPPPDAKIRKMPAVDFECEFLCAPPRVFSKGWSSGKVKPARGTNKENACCRLPL